MCCACVICAHASILHVAWWLARPGLYWVLESKSVCEQGITVSDVAPGVAVDAPGIDLVDVRPQLQGLPLLHSAVHAAARARAAALWATLHVFRQAVALRVELAVLQPACHARSQIFALPQWAALCHWGALRLRDAY